MPIRFYLIPAALDLIPRDDGTLRLTKHPTYDATFAGRDFYAVDYGREGFFLVAADVTPAIHTTLNGFADVIVFPLDITQQIGAAAFATIDAKADARNIPLAGITATSTYRQLLRRIFLLCQCAQNIEGRRFDRLANPGKQQLFTGGITLASTWADLTSEDQDALRDAFRRFTYDESGLSATTTLRAILKAYADQWRGTPITIFGMDL